VITAPSFFDSLPLAVLIARISSISRALMMT